MSRYEKNTYVNVNRALTSKFVISLLVSMTSIAGANGESIAESYEIVENCIIDGSDV